MCSCKSINEHYEASAVTLFVLFHATIAAYFVPHSLSQSLKMAPISLLNASLKKRCRDSFESPPEDSPEALPFAKRKEHTSKAGTYRWHRPPNFWNRLSKVHLTRGALREFDRRTSRAHQPVLTPCSGINTSPGPGAKTVKRFSRQGGPDLAHVRGVSSLYEPHRFGTNGWVL